jgi:hypothetical protein
MTEIALIRKEQLEMNFDGKNVEDIIEDVIQARWGRGGDYYSFIIYHKTAISEAESNTGLLTKTNIYKNAMLAMLSLFPIWKCCHFWMASIHK